MDTTNVIKKMAGSILFLGGAVALSYLYFYKKDLSTIDAMWCFFAIALGARVLRGSLKSA